MASSRRRSSRSTTTDEREQTSRRARSRRPHPRDDDEDEEEAPARSRRSRSPRSNDEDDRGSGRARSSRRRDSDEDQEASTGRSRRSRRSRAAEQDEDNQPKRATGRGGWGAKERNQEATSTTSNYVAKEDVWKPSEEPQLIKFVDAAPFVSYAQHWINSSPKGRKGWECIAPLPYPDDAKTDVYGREGDCPLCEELSEPPRLQVLFNVLVLNEDDPDEMYWEYKVLRAGVTLSDQLEALNDGRHGPLDEHYWELSATGTKGSYSANAIAIRERDLDDWGIAPLTEDLIEDLTEEMYDADVISFPTTDQLEDVLDSMGA